MPSNSKRTEKSKRKSSRQSVDTEVKKAKKKKRKKKTAEQKAAEMKAAFEQVESNKKEEIVSTLVPVQLLSPGELESITRDNSFMLNPLIANASIQKDLVIASNRTKDLEALHNYLFDPINQSNMEDKTLVALYSIAINDHHKTIAEKIKISEISDKNRIIRDTLKYYVEKEKEREMESVDNSHTSEIIQALLSESMRHQMDDEIKKKWNGSNSYRPQENTDYEILAVDPDADKD